jgi:DNA-binding beta-propeller fold protein YncE
MHSIWKDNWARIPEKHAAEGGGRTHGVAVLANGDVVVFAQATPSVHIFSPAGELKHAWGNNFKGAHGLTLTVEDGREYLWLTDQYSGEVGKYTTTGERVAVIEPPGSSPYAPTWAAVSPQNGEIWVADGYGSNVIRHYTREGKLLGQLTGEEGAGAFACPHGIAFGPDGNLYVTDRAHKRLVLYDVNGKYLRHIDGVTHSPCAFAFHNKRIYIPELFGDVKVLDENFACIAQYGTNHAVRPAEGWPDQEGWGRPVTAGWPDKCGPDVLKPGFFSSPHGIAVAPNGDIYVVEWIEGGRITRLAVSEQ